MKYITSLLLLLFFFEVRSQDAHFRKSYWGDSKADVIRAEGNPTKASADLLTYINKKLLDYSVSVQYGFKNGALHQAGYVVNLTDRSKDDVMLAAGLLIQALNEKYGNPIQNDSLLSPTQSFYKSFADISHFWATPLVRVSFMYKKGQTPPFMSIKYDDLIYENNLSKQNDLESEQKRKKALKDF